MKITINLNKEQIEYIKSPNMFIDESEPINEVLRQIQRKINVLYAKTTKGAIKMRGEAWLRI